MTKRKKTLYAVLAALVALILLAFVAYSARRNAELQARLDRVEQAAAKQETFKLKGRNWNKERTVADAVLLGILLGDVPGVLKAHGIQSIKDADGRDYAIQNETQSSAPTFRSLAPSDLPSP